MSLDLKNYEPALKAGAQIGALAIGDSVPEASVELSSLEPSPSQFVGLVSATGSETNIALGLVAKGDAPVIALDSDFVNRGEFGRVGATDVNFIRFSSNVTGQPVIIEGTGDDTDVNVAIVGTGDGSLQLDTGTRTATAVAGAATLAKTSGVITTEGLTTAAGATYTLTLTNSKIGVGDQVYVSVANGTNTAGMPCVTTVTPAANSVVIVVQNIHAADALNGTLKISFALLK